MKPVIFAFFLLLTAAVCRADTFLLKDGTKIDGELAGEMDQTLLIKTRYGSLTVDKADIAQRQAAPAVPAQPAADLEAPVSTAAAETPAAAPELPEARAQLTFSTLLPEGGTRRLVYFESGVAIATETFDAAGSLVSLEGAIKNGTYSEYYADGNLKTVKTVLGGKMSGSLKAYYPAGVPQLEAYYFDGAKDGDFKYFGENGKPLMEAAYKNDRLNGWKREYGPDGALKNEAYYEDDRVTDPPKPAAAPAARAQEQDSLVTGRTTKVARGEIVAFKLNAKYIGKVRLDAEFNVIGQDGTVPDGTARVYGRDGKLQKEMLFKQNEVKALRQYDDGGALKATYTFHEGKATEFAQQ
ncbi:MAG: hypothetical protein WCK76_00120 [Elusimicrobiota bacterium]